LVGLYEVLMALKSKWAAVEYNRRLFRPVTQRRNIPGTVLGKLLFNRN
jgi:hypothetical protein